MGATAEMYIEMQDQLFAMKSQVEEGELSHLDCLIEMRKAREQAENVLRIVKEFEDENQNRIASEAEQYGGKYCGYEIKSVNGKKLFNFKGIAEVDQKEIDLKATKEKYSSAFEGVIKGIVQTTTDEEGNKFWVDVNGDCLPLPELSIGKSYLTVTKAKSKSLTNK